MTEENNMDVESTPVSTQSLIGRVNWFNRKKGLIIFSKDF